MARLLILVLFSIASSMVNAQGSLVLSLAKTDVTCPGLKNGTAIASATGGLRPYKFTWSTGDTTASINNLAPGRYSCTVTDVLGRTDSKMMIINEPASLQVSVSKVNVFCNGDATGSITLTTLGGTSPYTYNWSNGATTANLSGLTAGVYTCTVADANGCDTAIRVVINQTSALNFSTIHTNVRCNGGNDGSATVSVSGGTAPYTYRWSPSGGAGAQATGLTAGVYTCLITDANGCDTTASITIDQPSAISFTTTQQNILCYGAATGSAAVVVAGGTRPYTYSWSNGATTNSIQNVQAGPYTCTITDANGCDTSVLITITQSDAIAFTSSISNVKCNGGADGSATLNVTGGNAPYTYKWFPSGGTAATASNLAAGTYVCTITDANGCDTTARITVNQPALLSFTTSQVNILCNGQATGSASVTVSGGTSPYTYNWSNGATTASTSSLSAGLYTCTITDANGCDTTATVAVTSPAAIRFTTSQTNILCNGTATGAASVTVAGGVKPYTYSWSNGATMANISNVKAGTYTCVITDANGCDTNAVVIISENAPIAFTTSQVNVKCSGDNTGSATVTVSGGGTAPYTYQWLPSGGRGATAANLVAGAYTCTITDANGCDTTLTINITQPPLISFTVSQVNILCYGSATGAATISASGGTGNLTYKWSPYGGNAATANNLIAGTYTCTITDANGCDTTATVNITQLDPIAFNKSQVNSTCNGLATGSATVNVTGGGKAPYIYAWSPSGGTAATANGLAAGVYTCTITDANGCDTSVSFTITEPPALSATAIKTEITCNGANDGKAEAVVSGGSAPYTYKWSPGGETTPTIGNLGPGTYTCTATDANGCTITGTVELIEPALLISSSTHTNVTCNGKNDGTASASASGGTAPYSYSWSNGATTAGISALIAGTYTCTITDARGCTVTTSTTVGEPAVLNAAVTSTDVSCNGLSDGSVSANPSGGTAPYQYLWSNGATTQTVSNLAPGSYTVRITDANGCVVDVATPAVVNQPAALAVTTTQTNVGCNGTGTGIATANVTGGTAPYSYQWSPNGGTGSTATGLAAGVYTCNITDANGCTISTSVTITQNTTLTPGFTKKDVSCKGASDGSISLTPSGGQAPYTYSWTPGGATTASISNLGPGTYTCIVKDASGCLAIQTVEIVEPPVLKAKIDTTTNVTCQGKADGTARVNVQGGTAPYTYSWSPNGGSGASASGLAPGSYTCTVTDANGCTVTTSPVNITELPGVQANISYTNISATGANDGTATVNPSGGNPPYTYSWSPGGQTTPTVNNLAPGTYTCTVTDANGCTTTESVVIVDPTVLALTVSKKDVSCNGSTNGSATVNATGGTAPYTYLWQPGGQTTAAINNLAPGTYTCTVTDGNNDTQSITVTINEPALVSGSVAIDSVLCNSDKTGAATITAQGGTGPYTYLWSNGATTAKASNLSPGTYSCTITDANGCTGVVSNIVITQPLPITVVAHHTDASCQGIANGAVVSLDVSGGTAPYSYSWSPSGGTGPFATGLAPGIYTCLITDANGCDTIISVTIAAPPQLFATATKQDVSCYGANDGTATAVITGGTTPYAYSWDPGNETVATISNLSPGTYTCFVTDAKGCTIIGTVNITQPAALKGSATISKVITCKGSNDAAVTVNPSGGTAPYTYSWSTSDTSRTISNLSPGTYTCTITDSNNCTTTASVSVSEPDDVSAGVSQHNVTCHGGNDGSITLSGRGGTGPYTYLWNNGATTATLTGLIAGSYVCTITDSHGCTGTVTVSITEPEALAAPVSQTNATCNGNSDGIATVTVTGGNSPYTYLWSPRGGTGATATGLAAGTYTCLITDLSGCTFTATVVITQPDELKVAVQQTNVSCKGAGDGKVTLVPSGGTAPYRYSWSTGDTTATVGNLAPGTHTFTVTDAHGCQVIQTVEITEPNTLTASSSHTNVSCNRGNDGTATAVPAAGTAPYSYLWSPGGDTAATAVGLTAGTYTCTVTDSNGCVTTTSTTITEPTPLSVNVSSVNISCNGAADGTAGVVASGATAPYTYSWSNGSASANVSNLAPGTYTCLVTDSHGCDTTISVTITQPDLLSFTTSQTDILCNGESTGSAGVVVNGGTAPYTYNWSNGQTTATINNIPAGTYTCTITDTHGCDTTATVTITEPSLVRFATTHRNVLCHGGNTGSAVVIAGGGVAPYTYLWSNGDTTAATTGLIAGTYTCTITDGNGCDTTTSIIITEPSLFDLDISQVNVACNGNNTGSISILTSGSTPPYSYSWSNGATTPAIDDLSAGTYTCTITDVNGCDTTVSVTITEPSLLQASIVQQVNVLCNGDNTGMARVVPVGGAAPYTYNWQPVGITDSIANGLSAGTYTCTVTDANGCTITVTATITQPPALSFVTSATDVDCNGGSTGAASVTVSGGLAPYAYLWNNGNTTASIQNLTAGTYTCVITDANGCETTATVIITEASAINITTTQTNVNCNGDNTGSAQVSVSGGTAPYTYSWSNGATTAAINNLVAGTYTCTVTDAKGCISSATVIINEPLYLSVATDSANVSCYGDNNGSAEVLVSGGTLPYTYSWSNGATTATINNLFAGTYTCHVSDANGCDTTVTITVDQPAVLSFTVTQTNVACNGASTGSASVNVSGGTSPYIYNWSNGATTAAITNLSAGTYTCTITDQHGCDTTATVIITEAAALAFTTDQVNVSCNGGNNGSASVHVSGGVAPYRYSWSNGDTTATINNLTAGAYTCTITDVNGCSTIANITITEPTVLVATIVNKTDVLCNGNASGSAVVGVTGGVYPYSFRWSPGTGTDSVITNLSAGTYTCTVTDANGCISVSTVVITQPDLLTAVITSQANVSCNGGNDGNVTILPSGGAAPYTYSWSNGATIARITNLSAGTYSCVVTDANGCTTTITATITEPAALAATTSQNNVGCKNGNNGSAAVDVSGGTLPYKYLWSNGDTTARSANLVAGIYRCTITDNNGCEITMTVRITEPPLLSYNISQANVNCYGSSTGTATVDVSGGTAPYRYNWSNGDTTATSQHLPAGTYTCTITDANGCDTTASVTITQLPALIAKVIDQANPLCNGARNGYVKIEASGGTYPYTYRWQPFGGTDSIATSLPSGTYTCTITDANGCSTTTTAVLYQPDLLTATVTARSNVKCKGGNDGSATVLPSGGTPPYNFLWSNGARTARIDNLAAGIYLCRITGANGCVTTATVTITEPPVLVAEITHDNVSCNGDSSGSATIHVVGGTAPYRYRWSNGDTSATAAHLSKGIYNCVVTDADDCSTLARVTITQPDALAASIAGQANVLCNGANTGSATVASTGGVYPYTFKWLPGGSTDSVATGLGAGTYTCTITDARGCTITATAVITQPDVVTAVVTAQANVTCNGGNDGVVTILPSGGKAPYTYRWSNGAVIARIDGLSAGAYTCVITDANGCTATLTATVTQPSALSVVTAQKNIACNGGNSGSATATANGGTAPYTYSWSNGSSDSSIANLSAGSYTCKVTDKNGCDTVVQVTISEVSGLSVTSTKANVNCNGSSTGSATLTVNGGTAPYKYSWTNGDTTSSIKNLKAGTYSCTITDANGCNTSAAITITEAPAITFAVSTTNAACGVNNGAASVQVNGGTPPYRYVWSGGQSTTGISNVAAGNYTCTISDANGCDTVANIVISSESFTTQKTVTDANGSRTVEPNELLTYTIAVTNTGNTAIDSVIIADAVPANTVFVSSSQGTVTNNTVNFIDRNLGINETRNYSFVVRASQDLSSVDQITNTAQVKISAVAIAACVQNPTVTIARTPPVPVAHVDLLLTKRVEEKAVTVGDNFNYTIVVNDTGATAHNVVVTDTLPVQVTYNSNTTSAGTVSYDAVSRVLIWRIDSLVAGSSQSLTINVRAAQLGTVTNRASTLANEIEVDLTNNVSAVAKEIIPFKIPNVITPNGDGKNDKFFIEGLELYSENELKVFNRWNANVYQKKNYANDWDGSGLNAGTYFYVLRLKDSDGKWHEYKGYIMIMKN